MPEHPGFRAKVWRGWAYLWAAPYSLVGLLLLPLAGRVLRRHGCIWAVGGLLRYLLGRRVAAITLGHVVFAADDDCLARWWRHELAHVRQYGRYGPVFLPLYGYLALRAWWRGGDVWRDNPLEREAGIPPSGGGDFYR